MGAVRPTPISTATSILGERENITEGLSGSFALALDEGRYTGSIGSSSCCFQRDPSRQFAAIQRRLGSSDALTEYIRHTSSAIFAIPPGARPGGFVGEGLFA